MKKVESIIGLKFGRLTVIEKTNEKHRTGELFYRCICDCGNEKITRKRHLVNNDTKSCGCLNNEKYEKHGFYKHKLYGIYKAMMSRCYNQKNKKYKDYGGRGIFVCKEWTETKNMFFEWGLNNGYKEGLEIERIDNNNGYCPENCKWVTRKTQCRNTRKNIFINIDGVEKCISEWCEIYGLSKSAIFSRVHLNWNLDKNIILTPIKKRKKCN